MINLRWVSVSSLTFARTPHSAACRTFECFARICSRWPVSAGDEKMTRMQGEDIPVHHAHGAKILRTANDVWGVNIYQALTRRLHQTTFFDRFLRRMRSIGYNKIINIALAGLSSDVRILLDVAEEALPPDFMRNASSSSRDPSSLLGHIHTSYLLSCLRTQHCLDTVANLRQVLHFGSLFVLQPTQPPSLEHEMSTERPTPDIVHSDIVVLIFRFHGDASHLNVVRRKLARTRRNLLPHQTMLIVGVMDDDGDNDSNVCRHLKCISDILRRVGGRGGAALSQLTVQ
uniref:SAM-dependent MTase TRM10-type domain-containing protein n=1 Tax=Echinococcus granulosus TaxID=6210 RepID=A0A068WD84_ECHGR|nr:hypothetical protein EgrG_000579700 [Echinococcus granulosus]